MMLSLVKKEYIPLSRKICENQRKRRIITTKKAKYKQSFQRMDNLSLVKTIANPSQGGDAAAVRAKKFSELFDVGIYGAVITKEVVSPNFVDKLFAGKCDAAVFYKEEEKVIFAGGHIKVFAVNGNKSAGKIHHKSFVLIDLFGFRKGNAAAF